jgi:hypothetical protein
MNLATTYMGLSLKNPLIVGSSPLTDDLDIYNRCELKWKHGWWRMSGARSTR